MLLYVVLVADWAAGVAEVAGAGGGVTTIHMKHEPNSLILGGEHDGQRVYTTPKQHHIRIGDQSYHRVPQYLIADQDVFKTAQLSMSEMFELLFRSYSAFRKIENQSDSAC